MSHKILLAAAFLAAVVLGFSWITRPSYEPVASTTSTATSTITTTNTDSGSTSYTLADVATHKDADSCWSAINGKVYDLTTWINQHPGGQEPILSICGKDASTAFNTQHGGDRQPAQELTRFYIGTLSQ